MKSYAFINLKGGSGKTSSCVSVAAVLAERGRDVLLIDLDPQASLTDWVRANRGGMTDLLSGRAQPSDVVQGTEYSHLDIVASDRSLARMEEVRAAKLASRLEQLIAAAEAHYDYVLIDPPPASGSLVLTALASSEGVLAPVQAGYGAVEALGETLQLMRAFGGARLTGAFACRVAHTVNDQQVPIYLQEELNSAFSTFIRETVRVREAETAHVPLPYYDPDATATADYRSLVDELVEREAHEQAQA